ncbi:hypothetical protein C481_20286 [Natrialba asiatica DSM 12278]|uniref:Uncharacterized protein n=1 Tax=Natrialba asiatica (strain ATCC 700177 / DSM 12278 / JCM 9576 / FERM P-10747 / NBRC 102637 / 172P1) TaxID=29540 RepID=M0AF89_NATA1|nr:hypothetical protein C481_20286 [Natrialba asiatica DSM 12278]
MITTLEYLLIVTELLSKRFISRLKFVDTVVFLPECCLEFVDAVVDAELAGTGRSSRVSTLRWLTSAPKSSSEVATLSSVGSSPPSAVNLSVVGS